MRLILASASPRRRALLESAGFKFDIVESGVEEAVRAGELPEVYAMRVAREKALAVAASQPAGSIVLGADTVVVLDNEILNKPTDAHEVRQMLRKLSGRAHQVLTSVCLARPPGVVMVEELVRTRVTFRELNEAEIEDYIASGEPFDKAGAYGIQGGGGKFVSRVEGSRSNVVGLPVERVVEMLRPLLESGHGAIL